MRAKNMQALSSRIPPILAAAVASDLYKPHACLRDAMYITTIVVGNHFLLTF